MTDGKDLKKLAHAVDGSTGDAKSRLQEFFKVMNMISQREEAARSYANRIQQDLEIVDARDNGYVKFHYTVKDEVLNMNEFMHGGFIAVVFDIITSLALIVADQQQTFNMGGVSRTLDISYLRPIPRGSVVVFEAELLQKGRNTAYMTATAKSKETSALLASASHHKLNPRL